MKTKTTKAKRAAPRSAEQPEALANGESRNAKVAIIALALLLAYQSAVGLLVNADLVKFHSEVHSSVERMGAAFVKKNFAAVIVNSKGQMASDDKELEKANAEMLAAVDAASYCDDKCQQNLRVFTWSSMIALGVGITVFVAALFRSLGFRRKD